MEADEPGEYWGQCTEFCGLSHANMRMRVVALSRGRLGPRGSTNQLQDRPPSPTDEDARAGQTTFMAQCARCHQVNGLDDADGKPVAVPNAATQVVSGAVPEPHPPHEPHHLRRRARST